MFRALLRDIDSALRRDPAARSRHEVLLTYPGVHALFLHRLSHRLWKRGHRTVARLLSHQTRFLTGVEIHPGAQIADGVFIDHGMGVVIGETAIIEEGCIIYKGVVLGGTTLERRVRHPHLRRNVIVGSNACVLGAIEVGEGARIGSASVVIKDVPAGATVVGVPGRIVRNNQEPLADELDHAALPDPVADVLRSLAVHQETLADRLAALEDTLRVHGGRGGNGAQGSLQSELADELRAADDERHSAEKDPRRRAGSIF